MSEADNVLGLRQFLHTPKEPFPEAEILIKQEREIRNLEDYYRPSPTVFEDIQQLSDIDNLLRDTQLFKDLESIQVTNITSLKEKPDLPPKEDQPTTQPSDKTDNQFFQLPTEPLPPHLSEAEAGGSISVRSEIPATIVGKSDWNPKRSIPTILAPTVFKPIRSRKSKAVPKVKANEIVKPIPIRPLPPIEAHLETPQKTQEGQKSFTPKEIAILQASSDVITSSIQQKIQQNVKPHEFVKNHFFPSWDGELVVSQSKEDRGSYSQIIIDESWLKTESRGVLLSLRDLVEATEAYKKVGYKVKTTSHLQYTYVCHNCRIVDAVGAWLFCKAIRPRQKSQDLDRVLACTKCNHPLLSLAQALYKPYRSKIL